MASPAKNHSPNSVNLDIFWLRDESLEESANLPDPDVIAAEIVEDLRTAMQQNGAGKAEETIIRPSLLRK